MSDYLTNLIGQQRPKNTVPVPTQTQGPYVPPFPTKPKFKLLPDSPQDALRELGENFGVVGRGLAQGVAAPVTMIADPLTDFINQVLPKGYKQTRPGEAIGQGLDVAGVPRATTDAQKVLEAGTSGLAGGGAIAKTAQLAGKGAQALKGYLDTIGKDLAGQMTSGLGSGAGSVGATQAATASGASPVVAQLAGLGGGIVGGGARPVGLKEVSTSSVILDSKGSPLTVYHGAPDIGGIKESGFKSQKERLGIGSDIGVHWFTPDMNTAKSYADPTRAFDYQNAQPGVIAAELEMKNPLIIDGGGKNWREAQRVGKTGDLVTEAINGGHDGIIVKNVIDPYNMKQSKNPKITDTYAVFSNENIRMKSPNSGLPVRSAESVGGKGNLIGHRPPDMETGAPIHDLTANGVFTEDVYSKEALQYYGGMPSDDKSLKIAKIVKGKPEANVKIYRTVEKNGPDEIMPGDWVAIDPAYAKEHAENAIGDGYKLLSKDVPAKHIYGNADSLSEFGYHPNNK